MAQGKKILPLSYETILMPISFETFRFLEIDPLMDAENTTVIGFTYSDLRTDSTYLTAYTLWFRLFATAVVPFCIILFCNAAIVFYYRKNRYILVFYFRTYILLHKEHLLWNKFRLYLLKYDPWHYLRQALSTLRLPLEEYDF